MYFWFSVRKTAILVQFQRWVHKKEHWWSRNYLQNPPMQKKKLEMRHLIWYYDLYYIKYKKKLSYLHWQSNIHAVWVLICITSWWIAADSKFPFQVSIVLQVACPKAPKVWLVRATSHQRVLFVWIDPPIINFAWKRHCFWNEVLNEYILLTMFLLILKTSSCIRTRQ